MSTPNNSLQERGSEWKATAAAEQVVRLLGEMASDPSTKRFLKSRPSRIERWLQLERIAQAQVNGLSTLAKATVKRPRVPKVVTHEPDGQTPEQEAAIAEARCEGNR